MQKEKLIKFVKKLEVSTKFLLGALIISATSFIYVALAAPPTSPYNLGETLAPTCAHGDSNCTVDIPQESNAYLTDVAGITANQGDLIYFNGTNWVDLTPGTLGQFLKTQGAGANPVWGAVGTGGIDMNGEIIENIGNVGTDFTVTGGLTTAGEILGSNLSGSNTGDQDLSGLVPYTGATAEVVLGQDLTLADNKKLYFDTAKTWYLEYSTAHGMSYYGGLGGGIAVPGAFAIYGNTGADAGGAWNASIEIDNSGAIVLDAVNGVRIGDTSGGKARLEIDLLSVDRTFDFPNASGTIALIEGNTSFVLPNGTDLPATCSVGQIFQDTNDDACADVNAGDGALCICKASNSWALLSNF